MYRQYLREIRNVFRAPPVTGLRTYEDRRIRNVRPP
jgi:hypothetical protein